MEETKKKEKTECKSSKCVDCIIFAQRFYRSKALYSLPVGWLVSLFYGISTFVVYLMSDSPLVEKQ